MEKEDAQFDIFSVQSSSLQTSLSSPAFFSLKEASSSDENKRHESGIVFINGDGADKKNKESSQMLVHQVTATCAPISTLIFAQEKRTHSMNNILCMRKVNLTHAHALQKPVCRVLRPSVLENLQRRKVGTSVTLRAQAFHCFLSLIFCCPIFPSSPLLTQHTYRAIYQLERA